MCAAAIYITIAPLAHAPGTVTGGIKREAGMIAGHEPCGVVAAVGAGLSDKEARVERVMDHHYDGCGNCKHCRAGWDADAPGGHRGLRLGGHGGHARYMRCWSPRWCCSPMRLPS